MLTAVESIVEGTWGSSEAPAEFIDWFLMREMHWSFDQLQATPPYVRRYCYDFTQAVLTHEAEQADRAARDSERQGQR